MSQKPADAEEALAEQLQLDMLMRIPVIKGVEEIAPLKLLDGYVMTDSASYLLCLSKTLYAILHSSSFLF